MDFPNQFADLEADQGWVALFYELHDEARRNAGPQQIAKLPQNRTLNRYKDVHPIDATRVLLNDGENDYINANHVIVSEIGRAYILTQGPLSTTVAHFWQMIWEQESSGIIMLNRIIEKEMRKCHPYWPSCEEEEINEDGFRVKFISQESRNSYQVSSLLLTNLSLDESREVLHFHYTHWPDFGVPQTSEDFLDFLSAVQKSGVLSSQVGPCVIHCSAGIGRSGTFVLVDACLEMIRQSGDCKSVDVPAVLLRLRQQRLGLIQTPDQLRFSYKAIFDGITYLLDMKIPEPEVDESVEEVDEEEDNREGGEYPHLEAKLHATNDDDDDVSDDAQPPPLPPRDWMNEEEEEEKEKEEEEEEETKETEEQDDVTGQPPSKKEKLEEEEEEEEDHEEDRPLPPLPDKEEEEEEEKDKEPSTSMLRQRETREQKRVAMEEKVKEVKEKMKESESGGSGSFPVRALLVVAIGIGLVSFFLSKL